ncbi:uncharacterized protein LOC135646261 [Musa acuminata AAA Group]|uniref:uncharacterized protein LOC135646261 n=1 Tax=Musa acuminata AAA Group TaxID=214697 RepID=UPI0031D4A643
MDDARFPPHRRSKAPFRDLPPRSPFGRRYPDDDEDEEGEEEEDNEEEHNDMHQPMDDDYDDDSSSESRGKRKRIDELALGFEFAPRVNPEASAPSSKPAARTSTFDLLDPWGDRFAQNGRRSLRADEGSDIAKKVSLASKANRTNAYRGNRFEKYKKEKLSTAEDGNFGSKWVYFKKMDALMSSPSPLPGRQQPHLFSSSSVYQNRCSGNHEKRDGLGNTRYDGDCDDEDVDSDGLPPKRMNVLRCSDSSFRMLAESIQKFGDIYEKMEIHQRQQMAELERMRKEFQRDLEVQKRQILEKAQEEIAKLTEEGRGDDEEDREDKEEDSDDGDSADNLSGFVSASFFLTAFV